ncbi:hypothetical protein BZK37_17975 [Enterococcus casseliflavus]|nr:hypothetical protein BZK37_17975 [Enterococcus casseliflavus]
MWIFVRGRKNEPSRVWHHAILYLFVFLGNVSFVGLLHALVGCSDLCIAGTATEALQIKKAVVKGQTTAAELDCLGLMGIHETDDMKTSSNQVYNRKEREKRGNEWLADWCEYL